MSVKHSQPVETEFIRFNEPAGETPSSGRQKTPADMEKSSPRRSAYRNTMVGEKLQKLRDFVVQQVNEERIDSDLEKML